MPPDKVLCGVLRGALQWILEITDDEATKPHGVTDPIPTIARIARRALAESQSSESAPFTGPDTFRG